MYEFRRARARIFGVLYLVTFVTSIPALILFQPVLEPCAPELIWSAGGR